MNPAVSWVLLPLLVAYAMTFVRISQDWFRGDGFYEHAPLVVGFGLFLAWSRRQEIGGLQGGLDRRGWLFLAPGLLMHLAGAALMIDSMSAVSLVLAVPGAVLLACGSARWRALLSICGLVIFCVPMPLVVTGSLAYELKEIATNAGLGLAQALGSSGVRNGAVITFEGVEGSLYVAPECSGLRSLVALTTLGYCVAFFTGPQRGIRRWLIFTLAAPVAIASNVVRIALICGMSEWWDIEFASGTGHDMANALAWLSALLILLGLDRLLLGRGGRA